jgi:hypothetical protein
VVSKTEYQENEMKTTYTATAPDGTIFTRKSDHDYPYAVLVYGQNWYTERNGLPDRWFQHSFNSRYDLARKASDEARRDPDNKQVVIVGTET